MNEVRILLVESIGWVIARVGENLNGNYKLENPVLLNFTPQGIMMMPFLKALSKDTEMELKFDTVLANVTPLPEIEKQYIEVSTEIIV